MAGVRRIWGVGRVNPRHRETESPALRLRSADAAPVWGTAAGVRIGRSRDTRWAPAGRRPAIPRRRAIPATPKRIGPSAVGLICVCAICAKAVGPRATQRRSAGSGIFLRRRPVGFPRVPTKPLRSPHPLLGLAGRTHRMIGPLPVGPAVRLPTPMPGQQAGQREDQQHEARETHTQQRPTLPARLQGPALRPRCQTPVQPGNSPIAAVSVWRAVGGAIVTLCHELFVPGPNQVSNRGQPLFAVAKLLGPKLASEAGKSPGPCGSP